MTLDDVKAFYKDQFVRAISRSGWPAATRRTSRPGSRPTSESCRRGSRPGSACRRQRPPAGLEFVIADKPTPATAVSMGFPVALNRSSDDFFALWIAGSHFGEHRQHVSLLFQKIREERGQNYGDYAYIEHFVQGRDKFPGDQRLPPAAVFLDLDPAAGQLQPPFRHPPGAPGAPAARRRRDSEERFELVRTYLLNYTKLYAQTLDERLGWQMDSHYYGTEDFLAEAQAAAAQADPGGRQPGDQKVPELRECPDRGHHRGRRRRSRRHWSRTRRRRSPMPIRTCPGRCSMKTRSSRSIAWT